MYGSTLTSLASERPILFTTLILTIAIWSLTWKGLALWRSAGERDLWWFIILLLVNTLGVLELVYLFIVLPRRQERYDMRK